jgi:vacuolar protein sorting-associated protein 26
MLYTILADIEDARRYFKQSEIVLYRQAPEIAASAGQQTQIAGAPPPERAQIPQAA